MSQGINFRGTGWFFRVRTLGIVLGSIVFLLLFYFVVITVEYLMPSGNNKSMNFLQTVVSIIVFSGLLVGGLYWFLVPRIKFRQLMMMEDHIYISKADGEYRIYYKDIRVLQVTVIIEEHTFYKERYSGFRFVTDKGTYAISMLVGDEDKMAFEPMSNKFFKLLNDRLDLEKVKCKKSAVYKKSYRLVYKLNN